MINCRFSYNIIQGQRRYAKNKILIHKITNNLRLREDICFDADSVRNVFECIDNQSMLFHSCVTVIYLYFYVRKYLNFCVILLMCRFVHIDFRTPTEQQIIFLEPKRSQEESKIKMTMLL